VANRASSTFAANSLQSPQLEQGRGDQGDSPLFATEEDGERRLFARAPEFVV